MDTEHITGDNIINITQLCRNDSDFGNTSYHNFSEKIPFNESVIIDSTISFVFNGLGLLFLAVVGVTINVLSVIVLSHRRLKSSLTTLLLGLTISDTVVISTSFLIFGLSEILQHLNVFAWYGDIGRPFLIPWLLPIALIAQMTSVYFTVVITLERYVAVCLPLQARSLCTRSSAKWSSLAIIFISFLYNIPRWFEFKVIPKEVNCATGEVTLYQDVETKLRKNDLFITYYINWAYLVLMYIIPFTILVYFNAAIYKQTKMHREIRSTLSPSMTQHNIAENVQLAGMLFGIVITFISCNMLAVAINLIESLGLENVLGVLIPISNFLIVLGCSTNFIFYCVYGTEFRRRLRRTLRITSSRKSSCTRSELWSEKDGIIPGRQRLESLQIPHLMGTRSRSNSNCSRVNNNLNVKDPIRANTLDSNKGDNSQRNKCTKSQSTTTVVTIVSNEM